MSQLALTELDDDHALVEQPSVDRELVRRYIYRSNLLHHLMIAVFTFGMWAPFVLVWVMGLGQWYARRRAEEIQYRLFPGRLLVSDGVFTRVRKTIPLDKVTDVSLTQGIVERWFGLWRLNVQTASSGHAAPEATLFGISDPKAFRRLVLERRDAWREHADESRALASDEASQSQLEPYRGTPAVTVRELADRLERIENHLATIAANTERKT